MNRLKARFGPGCAAAGLLCCRGCLGPLDASSEAGLCGRCWAGLVPLAPQRCSRCALLHGEDRECPDPVAWEFGDALWEYRAGHPPLGALLVPAIKAGERGWMRALLARVEVCRLPEYSHGVQFVVPAPPSPWRRLLRGFDLAEEASRILAGRIGVPCVRRLDRSWFARRQATCTESERRRMPRKAIRLRSRAGLQGRAVLLVDDVWTTGTTLLHSARALLEGGASEVRVLTLFRAT